MPTTLEYALALDVGTKRVGVAIASLKIRLPHPLQTLGNDDSLFGHLEALIRSQGVSQLVVGLPRGLDGQETAQTGYVRKFAEQLRARFKLPIELQDEALSSVRAKEELEARGKIYQKDDIDALAATFILEDYLANYKEAETA